MNFDPLTVRLTVGARTLTAEFASADDLQIFTQCVDLPGSEHMLPLRVRRPDGSYSEVKVRARAVTSYEVLNETANETMAEDHHGDLIIE